MRYGCVFPTCEIGSDPGLIREFAQTAEGLGYRHLVVYDHVLGAVHADREPRLRGPYDETHPFHEPLVLLAHLAGVTTTIELVTGVLVSPQRQTALIAKQAAELALLSGGRFRLGVGTGWNHVEYDALGASFDDRGRVLDEQIEVWRRLWTGDVVSYHGEFHHLDRVSALPAPPAPVPIWFGGGGAAALRRAARVGDGFTFGTAGERSLGAARRLLELLDDEGRRDGFTIDALLGFGDGPDGWDAAVESWGALGADTLSVRTMSASSSFVGEDDPGLTEPRQHLDALATFMSHVGG